MNPRHQNSPRGSRLKGNEPNAELSATQAVTSYPQTDNKLNNTNIMAHTTVQIQDLSSTQEFLSLLPRDIYSFRLIHEDTTRKRQANQTACYEVRGTLKKCQRELKQRNREGYGIFVVVNDSSAPSSGSTKDEDVTGITALFTDYDGDAENLPIYGIEPSSKVQTSEGKEHAYFLVNDCNVSDFKKHQESLAMYYQTDDAITNPSRVMRLPGFFNMKQKNGAAPFLTRLVSGSGKAYTVAEVIAPTRKKVSVIGETDTLSIPSEVMDIVGAIVNAPEGSINAVVFKVSCELGRMLGIDRAVKFQAIESALSLRGRTDDKHHLATAEQGLNKGECGAVKKSDGNILEYYHDLIVRTCEGRLHREAYGLKAFFDGEEIKDVQRFYVQLSIVAGVSIPSKTGTDIVSELLVKPEYQRNALQEQFLRWGEEHGDDGVKTLYELPDHLGLTDPLDRTKVTKQVLALAARTLYPGYKHDYVLNLIAKQGMGKTQFSEVFVGSKYTVNINPLDSDRETSLKMSVAGVAVMDEVVHMVGKRDINHLKTFMSAKEDKMRPLYTNSIETLPRHCVLIATSNEPCFLNDPTGSRRFWNVEPAFIDLTWLKENQAKYIGGAVHIVKTHVESNRLDPYNLPIDDYLTWLSPEEEETNSERNKGYALENPLEEPVLKTLEEMSASFGITEFLTRLEANGLEVKATDKVNYPRLSNILRANGCEYKVTKVNGKQRRVWFKAKAETQPTTHATFVDGDKVTVEGKSGVHTVSHYYQPNGEAQLTVAPINSHGKLIEGATIIDPVKLTHVDWKEGQPIRGIEEGYVQIETPTLPAAPENRYAKKG